MDVNLSTIVGISFDGTTHSVDVIKEWSGLNITYHPYERIASNTFRPFATIHYDHSVRVLSIGDSLIKCPDGQYSIIKGEMNHA